MRLVVISRASALISCAALLCACPQKDSDVAPAPATPGAAQAIPAQAVPASDKAGAEAPAAPPKKKDDDKGGW